MDYELYGYKDAIELLNTFNNDEYLLRFINKFNIFIDLYKIIIHNHNSFIKSPLISHSIYYYDSTKINIQHNIYNSVKNKHIYLIINDYYCHSLFITLISNPSAHVLFINEQKNEYTSKIIDFIKKIYNTASIEYHDIDLSAIIHIVTKFGFDLIIYNEYTNIDNEYIDKLNEISNKNLIIL